MKKNRLCLVRVNLLFTIILIPSFVVAAPVDKISAFEVTQENTTSKFTESNATQTEETTPVSYENTQHVSGCIGELTIVSEDQSELQRDKLSSRDYKEDNPIKIQTTEVFIQLIAEQAEKIADDHDLYASVMIAQAILESGSGNSSLSVSPYNNLFGVKGSYQGVGVTMNTEEEDASGEQVRLEAEFRQYPSYKESLKDYACLLKAGITSDPAFYKGAWRSETTNYQEATAFLTGRYATDTRYAQKLNQLILLYELTQYDTSKQMNQEKAKPVKKNVEKNKIASLIKQSPMIKQYARLKKIFF